MISDVCHEYVLGCRGFGIGNCSGVWSLARRRYGHEPEQMRLWDIGFLGKKLAEVAFDTQAFLTDHDPLPSIYR